MACIYVDPVTDRRFGNTDEMMARIVKLENALHKARMALATDDMDPQDVVDEIGKLFDEITYSNKRKER